MATATGSTYLPASGRGAYFFPLRFAVAIDSALRQATQGDPGAWTDDQHLPDLAIAAVSGSAQGLPPAARAFSQQSQTKSMLSGEHHQPAGVFIDNKKVEDVEDFTYLSRSIKNHTKEVLDHEIVSSIQPAWEALEQ